MPFHDQKLEIRPRVTIVMTIKLDQGKIYGPYNMIYKLKMGMSLGVKMQGTAMPDV